MMPKMVRTIFYFVTTFIITVSVSAEDIKNYSGCDFCHGAIHYGADEAKKILGPVCMKLFARLDPGNHKMLKIDLDGILKNGSRRIQRRGQRVC